MLVMLYVQALREATLTSLSRSNGYQALQTRQGVETERNNAVKWSKEVK